MSKDWEFEAMPNPKPPESCCVVRLKTSVWSDKRGLNVKRSLQYLRKKSYGYNILEEDVGMMGAEDAHRSIENIDSCEDGIYEVIACNLSHDWESGHVDDYDLRLIPYREPK